MRKIPYTTFHLCMFTTISLIELCFGIYGLIFITKYSGYESMCFYIWELVLATSLFSIFIVICTLYNLFSIAYGEEHSKIHSLFIFQIMYTIVITSVILGRYGVDKSCQDFWISSAPELWNFIVYNSYFYPLILAYSVFGFCELAANYGLRS